MRVLFALPGLHRVNRGAEIAFESLAQHLSGLPGVSVTLIGSGQPIPDRPYRFIHAGCVPRERFEGLPSLPFLRTHYAYEELTFAPTLMRAYRPDEHDITITCGYPYTNWVLRMRRGENRRPRHVFVTENGDWMCRAETAEYRHFGCDGLVCTNPEYYDNNKHRWRSTLIPNGVDLDLFHPGPAERSLFNITGDAPVVLMVSALIPGKRVIEGIRAAARLPEVQLIVAGDGEMRHEADRLGSELMGQRYRRLTLPRKQMPALYRCADVLLHMSQDEPFGNIYLEALASGLPVVAHDWAVTRWMLEDQAVFVDTSSEQAVADGIVQALSRKRPSDVAARRRQVERRFVWPGIALQYQRFFEQVLEEDAGRS